MAKSLKLSSSSTIARGFQPHNDGILKLILKIYYLRFGSSGCSIWASYTSFESYWPADFDDLSFGSIPSRCVMTWDIV